MGLLFPWLSGSGGSFSLISDSDNLRDCCLARNPADVKSVLVSTNFSIDPPNVDVSVALGDVFERPSSEELTCGLGVLLDWLSEKEEFLSLCRTEDTNGSEEDCSGELSTLDSGKSSSLRLENLQGWFTD